MKSKPWTEIAFVKFPKPQIGARFLAKEKVIENQVIDKIKRFPIKVFGGKVRYAIKLK